MHLRRLLAFACFAAASAVLAVALIWTLPKDDVRDYPIALTLLESNARYPYTDGVFRKGWSTIHQIDEATAIRIERALRREAARVGLPVAYLAAYIQQESAGDPRAEYVNVRLYDAATDDVARFSATDHGLVQISGVNLLALFPGQPPSTLKARAEDIDFATRFLADLVTKDMGWAGRIDPSAVPLLDSRLESRARAPHWLTVLAYNRGRRGALSALANPRACRHAESVFELWHRLDERLEKAGRPDRVRPPVFPLLDLKPDDPLTLMDSGPKVEVLQTMLNDKALLESPLKVDGNFGERTRGAVMRFQRSAGIEPTGRVDDMTWNKLLGSTDDGPSLDGYRPLTRGDKGSRVSELQRMLNDASSPSPAVKTDGDFGPATEKAVMSFQSASGLAVTGIVDMATMSKLASSTASAKNDSD